MRVEGSKVELAENRLILGQFYSTLLNSPSIQTNHYCFGANLLSTRIRSMWESEGMEHSMFSL